MILTDEQKEQLEFAFETCESFCCFFFTTLQTGRSNLVLKNGEISHSDKMVLISKLIENDPTILNYLIKQINDIVNFGIKMPDEKPTIN